MKLVFVVTVLLVSGVAQACVVSRSGPEYDSLIQVEKQAERNTYRVSVPSKLEGLDRVKIMLAYSSDHASGLIIMEPYRRLTTEERDGRTRSIFTVERRKIKKPFIVVEWWSEECCACEVSAKTAFLNVE